MSNNRYRYYTCSTKARQGETGCAGEAYRWRSWTSSLPCISNAACWLPSGWRRFSPRS
jgi:hypothetical protein